MFPYRFVGIFTNCLRNNNVYITCIMVDWLTGYKKVPTFHDYAQRQKNACEMDRVDLLVWKYVSSIRILNIITLILAYYFMSWQSIVDLWFLFYCSRYRQILTVETKFIAHLPASFSPHLLNCNSTSSLEILPLVYFSELRNSCMCKYHEVEVSDIDQCVRWLYALPMRRWSRQSTCQREIRMHLPQMSTSVVYDWGTLHGFYVSICYLRLRQWRCLRHDVPG